MKPKKHASLILAVGSSLLAISSASAADGSWNVDANGTWSTAGNWTPGIADGSGFTANFTNDITNDRTVSLDTDRTLTNVVFGDSDTSSAGSWILNNNGVSTNNLILAGTTPTITVNALGAGKTAAISAIIQGTSLTKAGDGRLILSAANTYTGATNVNAGTLELTVDSAILQNGGAVTVASGASIVSTGASIFNALPFDSGRTWNVSGTIDSTGGGVYSLPQTLNLTGGTLTGVAATGGAAQYGTYYGGNSTFAYNINTSGAATITAASIRILNGGQYIFNAAVPLTVSSIMGTNSTVAGNGWTLSSSGASTVNFSNTATPTYGTTNQTRTLTLGGINTGDNTFAANIANNGTGAVSLSKTGASKWILSGASTYTGATNVNGGTLSINGNQQAATGAVTVAVGATDATAVRLKGTGTVGGNTSFTADPDGGGAQVGGIHSPGNSVGKQTFDQTGAGTTNLTYNTGSIFEWELASTPAATIITDNVNYASNRGTAYDAVNVTGTLGGTNAIFRVVLDGTQTFASTFWDTNQSWTDIFRNGDGTGSSNSSFASIFGGGFQYYNYSGVGATLAPLSAPTLEGAFSISGSTLTWTAVPEPTSALTGLLLGAGLLRRRRK